MQKIMAATSQLNYYTTNKILGQLQTDQLLTAQQKITQFSRAALAAVKWRPKGSYGAVLVSTRLGKKI